MNEENVDFTANEPPVEPTSHPGEVVPQEQPQPQEVQAPSGNELKLGDTGDEVAKVQQKIGKVQVTGQFDEKTQARVLKLQRLWGLVPTGVVDAQTWEKIG